MTVTRGTLYLVATPIGNLEDITFRALKVLESVDVIACEDTRVTRRLLNRYDLKKNLISYRQGVEEKVADRLIPILSEGKSVALVTDAGVPLFSDPGFLLVRSVLESGIGLEVIPGPSAIPTALALSGLPPEPFAFFGFLPRKGTPKTRKLNDLARFNGTVILFESPKRVKSCLRDLAAVMGDRPGALVREMTKIHEEVIRGTLSSLQERDLPARGEYTIVIGPPAEKTPPPENPELDPIKAASLLVEAGLSTKTARELVAFFCDLPKKEAYKLVLKAKQLSSGE